MPSAGWDDRRRGGGFDQNDRASDPSPSGTCHGLRFTALSMASAGSIIEKLAIDAEFQIESLFFQV